MRNRDAQRVTGSATDPQTRLDPRAGSPLALLALAVVAFVALVAAAPPPGSSGTVLNLVDAPSQGAGSLDPIEQFGPLILLALAAAVGIATAAGAVILFRTRASAAPPPASEEWWSCGSCGAGNMEGAARCHACGTWRAAKARPTPSATR